MPWRVGQFHGPVLPKLSEARVPGRPGLAAQEEACGEGTVHLVPALPRVFWEPCFAGSRPKSHNGFIHFPWHAPFLRAAPLQATTASVSFLQHGGIGQASSSRPGVRVELIRVISRVKCLSTTLRTDLHCVQGPAPALSLFKEQTEFIWSPRSAQPSPPDRED